MKLQLSAAKNADQYWTLFMEIRKIGNVILQIVASSSTTKQKQKYNFTIGCPQTYLSKKTMGKTIENDIF